MISKSAIAIVACMSVMPIVLCQGQKFVGEAQGDAPLRRLPTGVAADVSLGAESDATDASVTGLGTAPNASTPAEIAKLRAIDIDELWHPYCILYTMHMVVCAAAIILTFKFPKVLLAIMLLGGLVWPISYISGKPIWGAGPPGADGDAGSASNLLLWWGIWIKWLIVSALATVPVLWLRVHKATKNQTHCVGVFINCILGANILWTIGAEHEGHVVRFINAGTGIMLVISLILHCTALRNSKRELFEVVDKGNGRMVYGNITPFWWLVCYTVWNVFFIAEMTVGGTLQDVLFWITMYAFKYYDPDQTQPIELYFIFARSVQLGAYIVLTESVGLFIPYLNQAPILKIAHPLPINSNAYFLFVVAMNFLWSLVCVFWAAQEIYQGIEDGKFRQKQIGDGTLEDEEAFVGTSSDDES